MADQPPREGSLDAPTRHPLDWLAPSFTDPAALQGELDRIFEICHGCRRCFSLCNAFPTLFDAIDGTPGGELAEVPKGVYWDVVDHCYLCDLCYMTKCPYVPPHPWAVDFPHLMLRAKAQRVEAHGLSWRDRVLSSTEAVGQLAGIPVVVEVVNTLNRLPAARVLLEKTLGVARDAPVPTYHSHTARKRLRAESADRTALGEAVNGTQGRVVLFTTCYGNRNLPELCEDLMKVYARNQIPVALADTERCCGMPKLELGDLQAVAQAKDINIRELMEWVREGWDIVAPIPSCVLMFKQELPLMFPNDAEVAAVAAAFFDPFEYLALRHKAGKFSCQFVHSLGRVAYHVPCHLRVQNIGLKTKEILELVPDTQVQAIERCSGHDGTYGVKARFREQSVKIARPVITRVNDMPKDHFTSDCPMAGAQILSGASDDLHYQHPLSLLRFAYGD